MFDYMHQGHTVKEAFDWATADYPMCGSAPSCMRFAGDEDFTPIAVEAGFVASPIRGKPPLAVQFTDRSKGDPTTWLWQFGDGETSNEQNPSHTYTDVGKYTVTLEVSNSRGSDTETKPGYIRLLEKLMAMPWQLLLT
jgi:PKD repeat protein